MYDKKKNAHQQLLSKRSLFFQIGLVLSLAMVIAAFEWKTPYAVIKLNLETETVDFFFEAMENKTLPKPLPPAPKVNKPKVAKLVDDVPDSYQRDEKEVSELDELDDLLREGAPVEKSEEFTNYRFYPAEYPGGKDEFYNYIRKELKYPAKLQQMGISGTVILSITIAEDGAITDIKVLKSIHEQLDKEAIRVLENAPKWQAAERAGQKVKMRMQIPISFVLE